MRLRLLAFILIIVSATCAQARSDQAPEPKVCTAVRIDGVKPNLDGHIDDQIWNLAEWSGEFIQRTPEDGAAPVAQTKFKILYDDEAIYFCFRMYDDPNLVRNILDRRDRFPGDWVEVNIDSYHDFRTAFSFTMSLSGTRGDEFISNDGNNWAGSWDPIWEGATQVDAEGWTAETKIPLSQLRFDGADEQVWGLQVQRRIHREEERSTWQPIPKDISGWVSNFGEIHGIRGIKPGRRVELLPYGLAKTDRFEEVAGNPFKDGSSSDLGFGLDGKIGLTSDLTVDFTINPDFGQVEADPSQINLTAFETYFSEKRPFFVEGADIFSVRMAPAITGGHFTRDKMFYSRRIGKRPAYSPDLEDGEYADVPVNTSILGAFKLSGKTAGGTSIGIMESFTARERATISSDGHESKETVEPPTNYFVGRVMQDFRGGNTVVGAMMTAVNRNIEDDHLQFLRRSAYAGGIDLQHYFNDRDYRLEARVFASHIKGSADAIDDVQTSSARYFQRPDNDHTEYDPTLTSISGSAGSLYLMRSPDNSKLRGQTGVAWRTPGFEINDLGYMRRADEINQSSWVGYSVRNPFFIFNRWSLNGNQWLNWDTGGNFLGASLNMNSNMEFKNRWNCWMGMNHNFEETSNTELRGGPASKWPSSTSVDFGFNSDHSKDVQISGGIWARKGAHNYVNDWDSWANIRVRPSNTIRISLNPSFHRNLHKMQYVTSQDSGENKRYILANLDQKTFSLTFRMDYCITPNLTVQYYGSPFISSAKYSGFKRVADPKADRYQDRYMNFGSNQISYDSVEDTYSINEDLDSEVDYEFSNPNFNGLFFNSNVVVRWEYGPGSTLFLVWSQARSDFLSSGELNIRDDMDKLFDTHPHNVFLVKFNKWFSL